MELGYIDWFGKVSPYETFDITSPKHTYGFIQGVSSSHSVFLHRSNIIRDSLFLKFYSPEQRKKWYVVYDIAEKEDGKQYATNVLLLSELPSEEQKELFKNENVLRESMPSAFQWSNPLHSDFKQLKPEYQMEIVENFPYYKEKLISHHPDWYFDNDYEAYLDYFKLDSVKKLFFEHYLNGDFSKNIYDMLRIANEKGKKEHIQNLQSLYHQIDWTTKDRTELLDYIKESKDTAMIYAVIKAIPGFIDIDEDFCVLFAQLLNSRSLGFHIFDDIKINAKNFPILFDRLDDFSKSILCNHTDVSIIINYPDAVPYLSDKKCTELIEMIDFTTLNVAEPLPASVSKLLIKIEANKHVATATYLVQKLYDLELSFNLNIWQALSESVKVRNLIFLSNFWREWRIKWNPAIATVYKHEVAKQNLLIIALLKYLVLVYECDDKQERFLERKDSAHNVLMKYITDSFNNDTDVSPALETLLEKCHQEQNHACYFCDGKWVSKSRTVFCPRGENRPFHGHRQCMYKKKLQDTRFKSSNSYSKQGFTDFLRNIGFTPDLTEIGIKDSTQWEYSYKFSAYVNRLIKMKQRLVCRHCRKRFHINFEYSKKFYARLSATRFYCPDAKSDSEHHDNDVYVNYCYHCKHVIDSRECRHQDASGYYYCMHCGGTEYVEPGTVCPSCANKDQTLMEKTGNLVRCTLCNHTVNTAGQSW